MNMSTTSLDDGDNVELFKSGDERERGLANLSSRRKRLI